MADEINFKNDGNILIGSDLMQNLSFALTAGLNFALDGATITNQDGDDIDLFTSDTASGLTNATYDAGTDRYDITTGGGTETGTIITDFLNTQSGTAMAIVKSLHTLAGTTTLTTSVSADDGATFTTVSQRELTEITAGSMIKVRFQFIRTNTASTDNLQGYALYYA